MYPKSRTRCGPETRAQFGDYFQSDCVVRPHAVSYPDEVDRARKACQRLREFGLPVARIGLVAQFCFHEPSTGARRSDI